MQVLIEFLSRNGLLILKTDADNNLKLILLQYRQLRPQETAVRIG